MNNLKEISNLAQLRDQQGQSFFKKKEKPDLNESDLAVYLFSKDIKNKVLEVIKKTTIPYKIWSLENINFNNLSINELVDIERTLSPKNGITVFRKMKTQFNKNTQMAENPHPRFLNLENLIVITGHYLENNDLIYKPKQILKNIRNFYSKFQSVIDFEYELKEIMENKAGIFKDSLIRKYGNVEDIEIKKTFTVNKEKNIVVKMSINDINNLEIQLIKELIQEANVMTLEDVKKTNLKEVFNLGKMGSIVNELIYTYRVF